MCLVAVLRTEQQKLKTPCGSTCQMMIFFLGCDVGPERHLWDRENLAFCPSSCTRASECCRSAVDIGFNMKFYIWLGL